MGPGGHSRYGKWRVVALAALCVGFSSLSVGAGDPVAGQNDPAGQVSREDVLRALGANDIPADYVILVDTSQSMTDFNLYPLVKGAVGDLVGALEPNDHLSLITFDSNPTTQWSDPVGSSPAAVIARLPAEAHGRATDIGAAIASGVDELERPGASQVGAIVLITDGQHQPPASTDYPTDNGPPWDALRQRATVLRQHHLLRAYGYALQQGAQAGLLDSVFTNTTVLHQPASQLQGYFGQLKERIQIEKARQALGGDLHGQIAVGWPHRQLRSLDLNAGSEDIEVRLRSRLTHVPLVLSHVALRSGGVRIEAEGLPNHLTLDPGQSRTLRLTLKHHPIGGFGFGQTQTVRSGELRLGADITSPWQQVLDNDLHLRLRPEFSPAVTPVSATGQTGWSWPSLIGWALVLVLVLLVLWRLYWWRQPPLVGRLRIDRDNEPVVDAALGGKKRKLGKKSLKVPGGDLRGSVRSLRQKSDYDDTIEYGVIVKAKASGKKRQSKLVDGGSMQLGSYDISYTR